MLTDVGSWNTGMSRGKVGGEDLYGCDQTGEEEDRRFPATALGKRLVWLGLEERLEK